MEGRNVHLKMVTNEFLIYQEHKLLSIITQLE